MKINAHPICRNMPVISTGFKFYKIEKGKQELFFGVEQIVTWCFNLIPESTFFLIDCLHSERLKCHS